MSQSNSADQKAPGGKRGLLTVATRSKNSSKIHRWLWGRKNSGEHVATAISGKCEGGMFKKVKGALCNTNRISREDGKESIRGKKLPTLARFQMDPQKLGQTLKRKHSGGGGKKRSLSQPPAGC